MSSSARSAWAILTLAAACVTPVMAQRWKTQYFYDKGKSTLVLGDIQFPSAQRGVAVGVIWEGKHQTPVALVTADGGEHWQQTELRETPVSLFFLNENLGWLVTTKGLWQTLEAGRSWQKLPKAPAGVARVYFADPQTGWAVGIKKLALETRDGGQHWKAISAAAEQSGEAKFSAYTWIAFASPQFGLITGWNQPPERMAPQWPAWMEPEVALAHRQPPHLSYTLVTHDGGKSWKSAAASLFGEVTRVRLGGKGVGMGLVEYGPSFRFASEAYKIDWLTGKSDTVYRDRKFTISDVWLTPDGTAYLAGVLAQGELRSVIPGKVQVLLSSDYAAWKEMEVDYRAVAYHAILAGAGDQNLWMATDNGMILKLVP